MQNKLDSSCMAWSETLLDKPTAHLLGLNVWFGICSSKAQALLQYYLLHKNDTCEP